MITLERQSHTLDILFPLGVFAAFAAAVITVLLMTAGVYRNNVEESANHFSGPTALAYVTEKLHQNDEAGGVAVGSVDGCDAIVLTQVHASGIYDTYIYCYDGSLRELMTKRELAPEKDMGRELIPMEAFQVEAVTPNLLRLSCTDETQTTRESLVALRSGEGS